MRRGLFTVLFSLIVGSVFSQANGDYQSRIDGDWHSTDRWQVFYNGSWRLLKSLAAGPYQNIIPTSSSGKITIKNLIGVSNNLSINQVTIANGGRLVINSAVVRAVDDFTETPLLIQSGGLLTVYGTLDLQTQLSSTPVVVNSLVKNKGVIAITDPSLLTFSAVAAYEHMHPSGGNIPLATWDVNSQCRITGMNFSNPLPPGNLGQSFGNFIWNTPSMGNGPFSLGGGLQTINGNLIFINTGNPARTVRLARAGSGYNLTIGQNLIMNAGYVALGESLSSATSVTIGGDLIINGGTFYLGSNNNSPTNVFLNGNFQKLSGNIISNGSGAGTIRFAGSGVHTYSNNSSITSAVHFSVQNGSTLNLGTAFLTGTGTFTLFSGGTINVGSTDPAGAIRLGTVGGNIRMSGARTYQAGSFVIYNGLAAQFMGNGQPPLANTTINNPNGVTVVSPVTLGGTFTVSDGTFDVGANHTVRINGNLVVDDTFEAREGLVRFGGAGPQVISGSSALTFFNMEIIQTAPSTVDIGTAVAIENNLAINSGSTLNAGTELLTLLSTPTRTANVNSLATTGAAIVGSVIVQRHLPKVLAIRDFHYMASPVTNSTFADWDNELPIARAFRYNEPTRRYVAESLGANNLINGRGYSVDLNSTTSFNYDTRGTLQQGNISIPVTSQNPVVESPDGWNLLGNPYPSAIDWDNITLPAGIYDAVYITDNFNNSGQVTGSENTYAVAYVDGVGTPASYSGTIAQGQAFWVKATANTNLVLTESAKITATNTQFYREKEIPNILRITLNGEGVKDEAVVRLREGATDRFDGKYDAYKFLKGDVSLATLTSDNVKAVINAFGTSDCDKAIALVAEGVVNGAYSFNFAGIESFDPWVSISLVDLVENKTIDVRKQEIYAFTVSDQNADSVSSRFQVLISGSSQLYNSGVTAIGESLCEDKDIALITIEKSVPGVEYSAEWNSQKVSEPLIGTGSALQLAVSTSLLALGDNEITIRTQAGTCSMASLEQKPVITKIKKPEIATVLDGNICDGGSATLIASGASENGWYHWYESENDIEPITGQRTGEFVTPYLTKTKTYYVSAVNAVGCEGNRVQVRANVSHVNLEQVVLTVKGSTLISSAAENNQWYFNNELLVDETLNTLEAFEPGLYTVTVTNGSCSTTASQELSSIENKDLDGVEAALISIYPNPTQQKVFIKVRTPNNDVSATVVNASGIEIETKLLSGLNDVKVAEFDLLPYATGIYNVRIVDGQKVFIKKIIKVK